MSFAVAVQKIAAKDCLKPTPNSSQNCCLESLSSNCYFPEKLIVSVSCGLSPFPTIHMLQSYPECDCIGNRVFREVIKLK